MKRNLLTLLTAGAVSAATLGAGGAFAETNGDDAAEVKAFLGASQTLVTAITAAETASGGKAVAAEFDESRGKAYYEIDTVANGKQVSVKIDAGSGAVIDSRDDGDTARGDDDIVDPAQLGAPLAELVARAEKGGSGKVMAISAEREDGQIGAIEVELANADGTTQDFAMAADGSLTPRAADADRDG